MTVYIIRRVGDESGLSKIGYTANIERRLKDISIGCPEGLRLVRKYPGTRQFEARLHDVLDEHRVSGEWFMLQDAHLVQCDSLAMEAIEQELNGQSSIPEPDDEYSENIVLETRFYLNELVKREWRGMGDSQESARDRVMDRLGVPRSYGFRLWSKLSELNDVSGEAYRSLRLAYALCLEAEDRLNDHQSNFLRMINRAERNRKGR